MQYDTGSEGSLLLAGDLGKVSVKLEFVLDERTITLAELNNLMSGSVLTLGRDAIMGVEIRIAGRKIAIGELIQMDERLGVELREVYSGLEA